MNFDGIGFNVQWVASMDQATFLEVMNEPGYEHIYEGDKQRVKKLKAVHKLCTKKVGAVVSDSQKGEEQ